MSENKKTLGHQSGVNLHGDPFVQLIAEEKVFCQLSAGEAREHAHAVLEAAEAAEQDAFLLDWAQAKIHASREEAAALLQNFRRYREERTAKSAPPSDSTKWVKSDQPPETK